MVHKTTSLDWDDYRFFLTLANAKSIRAAATQLGVSHSTVIRRLDNLEHSLDARLFERNAGTKNLTVAGEDVLRGAQEIEDSVQSISRLVTGRDSELAGVVKISMPEIFSCPSLFPDPIKFKALFPNIQLDVKQSYSIANLSKREADIAIRCTLSPPDDSVGRTVGKLFMASYATQAYIDKYQPYDNDSKAQFLGWGNPKKWKPRHGLDHLTAIGFFDNIQLQIDLAKNSVGVASLPCIMADREPELVRLCKPEFFTDIWVLYHADLRHNSRVRVVRDYLLKELGQRIAKIQSGTDFLMS